MLPPELSALFEAGSPAARDSAWTAFVETHSRLLLHTARGQLREHDAAMDAYAYLLEQLRRDDFRRLRTYSPTGRCKFTTWLVVVARRLCLDHVRQRYGRISATEPQQQDASVARWRLVELVGENIDPAALAPATSTAGTSETDLYRKELDKALTAAVGTLEPRDRLLLKLRFEDDLSAREIAQVLGFATPFHVYRRLKTLLETLRETLRERGVQEAEP